MKKRSSKKKTWIKFRHRVVRNILFFTLGVFARIRYNIKIERFEGQQKRPYLVLLNHQTPFDQFFVGMSLKGPIYYLSTEDIFSNGFVSSLIKYLVAPIPIKKQTTDVKAIINCIKVAKEGGTICIAPEGNRTYSGRTEYMSPSIAPLARKLGLPIALYRLEGGYGVQPRWSDVVRRGKMRGYVSEVIYPEQYADMTDDELFELIKQGLFVDEAVADGKFKHIRCAEYLERAMYVCPFCGLSSFYSLGDTVTCLGCKRQIKYLTTKELEGVGFDFPYHFVADWYDAQKDFINALDVLQFDAEPIYREYGKISRVIPCKKKITLCKNAQISLFGNRIEIVMGGEQTTWHFDEVTAVVVLGRNKLNVYHGGSIYQIKSTKRFNALKYVHIYHRYKNIVKGDQDVKFLGL